MHGSNARLRILPRGNWWIRMLWFKPYENGLDLVGVPEHESIEHRFMLIVSGQAAKERQRCCTLLNVAQDECHCRLDLLLTQRWRLTVPPQPVIEVRKVSVFRCQLVTPHHGLQFGPTQRASTVVERIRPDSHAPTVVENLRSTTQNVGSPPRRFRHWDRISRAPRTLPRGTSQPKPGRGDSAARAKCVEPGRHACCGVVLASLASQASVCRCDRNRRRCRSGGRDRLLDCHFGGSRELLVDLLLAPSQAGQFFAAVPRRSDSRFGPLRFGARRFGFLMEVGDGVGQPVQVAFESGDEVRRVAAAQVVGEEPDVDVRIGDGDADLVLDRRDRLGMDCEAAERSDLDRRATRLGWGLVESLAQQPLEMVTGVDSLGVRAAVDGHGESVAAGVDHPANQGFECGGTLLGVVRSVRRGVEGAA
jgi:hypothetical protein